MTTVLDTPSFLRAELLSVATDERGVLLEDVMTDDELARGIYRNLHVVSVSSGQVRGNHLHPSRTEYICAVGDFIARFQLSATNDHFEIEFTREKAIRFTIPPLVAHAFRNVGDCDGLLLCWADRPYDRSDVTRDGVLLFD